MKVPEDRNPCLTFVAAEKKPPSKFTKKGEVHKKAQRGSRVQRCCSHVAPVKVPEDRNPCLTLFAAEKKPASRFTKKGEVLKSTHEIAMEAIRSQPSPSRDLLGMKVIGEKSTCTYGDTVPYRTDRNRQTIAVTLRPRFAARVKLLPPTRCQQGPHTSYYHRHDRYQLHQSSWMRHARTTLKVIDWHWAATGSRRKVCRPLPKVCTCLCNRTCLCNYT